MSSSSISLIISLRFFITSPKENLCHTLAWHGCAVNTEYGINNGEDRGAPTPIPSKRYEGAFSMYYIIYETTNLVNNKKYRGAHATKTIEDGYLGSGRDLRMAIRKYEREQFTRTIIYMAFDYDAMWHAESLLVDQE